MPVGLSPSARVAVACTWPPTATPGEAWMVSGGRACGAIAIPAGSAPTAIGVPAELVARVIGVTLAEPVLTTNALLPPGVIAIPVGPLPTVIGVPAVFVEVSIGMTLPTSPPVAYAVWPSGVIATPHECPPTSILAVTRLVCVLNLATRSELYRAMYPALPLGRIAIP